MHTHWSWPPSSWYPCAPLRPPPTCTLQYSVGAPVNRAEVARIHDRSSSGAPTASGFWWLPLAAVAGGVALWQLVKLVGRGRRRSSGGRWVRDRSLGGKMVFIPDAELPGGSNSGKTMRPLYEDPDDGVAAAAAAAEAEAAGAGVWAAPSSSQAAAGAAAAEELPGWWEEPRFLVYTTFTRKEELQRQARLVLRELQDAKLQVRRGVGWGGVAGRHRELDHAWNALWQMPSALAAACSLYLLLHAHCTCRCMFTLEMHAPRPPALP